MRSLANYWITILEEYSLKSDGIVQTADSFLEILKKLQSAFINELSLSGETTYERLGILDEHYSY